MFDRDEIIGAGAIQTSGLDDLFLTPTIEDLRGAMDSVVITAKNLKGENKNDEQKI